MTIGFHNEPAGVQAALRLRAVEAVLLGEKKGAVARRFGVTRQSLHAWIRKHRLHGPEGLATRSRGPVPRSLLEPRAEAAVVGTITSCMPRDAGLAFPCWTRGAVAALVELRHGVRPSHWQVDRMLRRWGFAVQREVRRAYRRVPPAVRHLLARATIETLPAPGKGA